MNASAWVHQERTEPRTCPVCFRVCDAATAVSMDADDPAPSPQVGSLCLCAYCGTILVITATGWRPAREADLADLPVPLKQLLGTWRPLP